MYKEKEQGGLATSHTGLATPASGPLHMILPSHVKLLPSVSGWPSLRSLFTYHLLSEVFLATVVKNVTLPPAFSVLLFCFIIP